MKRNYFFLIGTVIVAALAAFSWFKANKPKEVHFLSENIEAIANSETASGKWIVTVYSPTRWDCTSGGGECCPDIDC